MHNIFFKRTKIAFKASNHALNCYCLHYDKRKKQIYAYYKGLINLPGYLM